MIMHAVATTQFVLFQILNVFSPLMQGAIGLRGDKVRGDSVSSLSGSSLMLLKQMISLLLNRVKLEPLERR